MSLEPIAIIGMGCRFPQADNPTAFWQLLRDGRDGITEVPENRWSIEKYYDPDLKIQDKTNSKWGGFLDKIDEFDPQFFGIAPKEVTSMDPQQRLILEVAWEALEDGGQFPENLIGTRTGVFIGIGSNDYWGMLWHQPVNHPYGTTGTANSMAANRLSYVLDLKGPSLAVDTACSSSLVAVHLACQSLWQRESTMALAGGVNVLLSPFGTIGFSKGGFLSGDGRCKSFDASANGYVRSEGAGVVVLKLLSEAKADNDPIYGLIRGSAINQDGRTDGIASPNLSSQIAVLRDAYESAQITPAHVQYIEAHGTGTPVGDRVEALSLGTVFSEGRTGGNCLIGSVKSNIGHLETAAGMAGLIKVILSLKHQQIPPSLHFRQGNPQVDFQQLKLDVNTTLKPWPRCEDFPRIAGVNSFGFGGTNAHIILEESPISSDSFGFFKIERPLHFLALSAKTESALRSLCLRYYDLFNHYPLLSLSNICFTANTRRTHFSHRLAIWGKNKEALQDKLREIGQTGNRSQNNNGILSQTQHQAENKINFRQGKRSDLIPSKIVFLFTGQASQYVNMGRELYETQPYFRGIIDRCNEILQNTLDIALIDLLYPDSHPKDPSLIDRTIYAQPALFAIEYALAKLWQSWGVTPSVVLGNSLGEYVAACVAGIFSLEDGLQLVGQRGKLMQNLPSNGAMVAVMTEEEQILPLIQAYPDVAIAGRNSPRHWVLSGEKEAVAAIIQDLNNKGIKNSPLNVSHGFHSALMEPMIQPFRKAASEISYHLPKMNIISNVTGDFVTNEMSNPDYWCLQTLSCVRFADTMQTLQKYDYQILMEMGPQPILLGMGQHCWQKKDSSPFPLWLASLRQGYSDWQQILKTLGELYVWGVPLCWQEFDAPYHRDLVTLPTYPFQRQSYWWETDLYTKKSPKIVHPLLGVPIESENLSQITYQSQINLNSLAYLNDHCLEEIPVFPATAYLEMALFAGKEALLKSAAYQLNNIKFEQFCRLNTEETFLKLNLTETTPHHYSFEVVSFLPETKQETRHAKGEIINSKSENQILTLSLPEAQAKCSEQLSVTQHYQQCQQQGLFYGTTFQGIRQLWRGEYQGLSQIYLANELRSEAKPYQIHPTLLDACFQTLGVIINQSNGEKSYLPVSVDQLIFYQPCPAVIWSYIELDSTLETTPDIFKANLRLWNEQGEIIADINGFSLRGIHRHSLSYSFKQQIKDSILYEIAWQLQPKSNISEHHPQNCLIFLDKTGLGLKLAQTWQQNSDRLITVSQGEVYQQAGDKFTINPKQLNDFTELFAYLQENHIAIKNIIYLWGITAENTEKPIEKQNIAIQSLLYLIQSLDRLKSYLNPQLYLITRATQSVTSEQLSLNPFGASLWGLSRVIRLEYPDLPCISIDLDLTTSDLEIQAIATEVTTTDAEDQIAYRQGERYVSRLLEKKTTVIPNHPFQQDLHTLNVETRFLGETGFLCVSPFKLKINQYGNLDSLNLTPLNSSLPKLDEVQIEVYAAGLNFRDVLNGLGMLKPYLEEMGIKNASEIPFGGECAGKIIAVGESVTNLKVGDEVMAALALGSLASVVNVKAQFVTLKPQNLSFIEAATIPTAFLTAYYGLHSLGKIKAGDSILIHSAAGGVGQAAVQIAQKIGADIFATTNPRKKQALHSLGIQKVMNSRTLEFADEVMELTAGKGVDFILNSLNGDYIPRNLDILSENGCLIEIGKIGIWNQEQVKERCDHVFYFPFDLLEIAQDNPDLISNLWSELTPCLETGDLKPLPYKVFPIEESVQAFRYMAAAKHIGKIVLTFPQNRQTLIKNHQNDTYLITGGWGALGLKASQWLVQKGVKQIILVGRSEPSPSALESIRHFEQLGTKIHIFTANVANFEELTEIFALFQQNSQKLRGIIHTAGMLDDGLLSNQTWERFEKVLEAKVRGTWNLHQITQNCKLDFFVCFSSIVSLIGSPGQGNYSAANAFMDALMHHRQGLGLGGLSINWGPWKESGMVASLEAKTRFSTMGINLISANQGFNILENLLERKVTQTAVFSVNWQSFLNFLPHHQSSLFLSSIYPDQIDNSLSDTAMRSANNLEKNNIIPSSATFANTIINNLKGAAKIEQQDILLTYLQKQLSRVLGYGAVDLIEPDQEFNELGMDSLMAVEFKNNIQADLGISLDNNLIFDFPSLELLNDYLLNDILNDILNREDCDFSRTNNYEELSPNKIYSQNYSLQDKKQQLTIPEKSFNWQLIADISPQFYQFERSSEYLSLQYESNNYKHIRNPFFVPHEDIARDRITIEGRTLINYASYNYLGLAGSPDIYQAVMAAIKRYGTSASASRILSGEIPLHQELEREIADFLGTEDCIVYIGGHTTNTTTIGHLLNKNDLILYDALSHNSIRQGCSLSGATTIEFPHNDFHTLEKLLQQHRPHYEKVLIVIEGIYSTDGDIAPLPEIIDLKKRYKTFLMVDEAHSIGVLGETGRGIGEYFNVNRSDVDLWMGTLSKSFVSCGGYIAASHAFVQYLKYTAPGFVFSVGMSPGNTAAALASLKLLKNEPERVKRLKMNVECFLSCGKHYGFDTGMSQGSPIVPVIVGESEKALNLSSILYQEGINVLPMIYPSVPHNAARLRFFLTVNHTEEQFHKTCEVLSGLMEKIG